MKTEKFSLRVLLFFNIKKNILTQTYNCFLMPCFIKLSDTQTLENHKKKNYGNVVLNTGKWEV